MSRAYNFGSEHHVYYLRAERRPGAAYNFGSEHHVYYVRAERRAAVDQRSRPRARVQRPESSRAGYNFRSEHHVYYLVDRPSAAAHNFGSEHHVYYFRAERRPGAAYNFGSEHHVYYFGADLRAAVDQRSRLRRARVQRPESSRDAYNFGSEHHVYYVRSERRPGAAYNVSSEHHVYYVRAERRAAVDQRSRPRARVQRPESSRAGYNFGSEHHVYYVRAERRPGAAYNVGSEHHVYYLVDRPAYNFGSEHHVYDLATYRRSGRRAQRQAATDRRSPAGSRGVTTPTDSVDAPVPADPAPTTVARHRWPWLLVMVAVGVAGAYLGAPSSETVHAAIDRVRGAKLAAAIAVIGGAIGLVVTEAIRIAVIGRLVGARVGARDAWDAAVANHVMTAVTPQVGLGEPTVAYLLGKRGVPWDAAVAIPFIKFSTSLALVFVLGAGLVAAGYGPPVPPWISAVAIAWFLGITIVTTIIIAAVARRTLALRWIAAIARWCRRRRLLARWPAKIDAVESGANGLVERVAAVSRWTVRDAFVLAGVHLVYYASYIAPLVGLGLALGDPAPVTLAARSLVYLCFVFAMPTPGGAGPSEAAAVTMFGDLMQADDALAAVILFRAATFYLQLAIGALYFPVAAALGYRPT